MPAITKELLRKRAEHNEGMVSTLEEVSSSNFIILAKGDTPSV